MSVGNYAESRDIRRLSGVIDKRGPQTGMPTIGMFAFGLLFTG